MFERRARCDRPPKAGPAAGTRPSPCHSCRLTHPSSGPARPVGYPARPARITGLALHKTTNWIEENGRHISFLTALSYSVATAGVLAVFCESTFRRSRRLVGGGIITPDDLLPAPDYKQRRASGSFWRQMCVWPGRFEYLKVASPL